MSIKKSSVNDVQAIMKLVHQAQLYFKNNSMYDRINMIIN